MSELTEALQKLRDYRAPEADIQWRIGNKTKDGKKATAFAYLDKREYERILNEIVGPENWHSDLLPWSDNKIISRVTIMGVTRASTGQKTSGGSDNEGPTAEAQSFKRACSSFGLMAYLYEFPVRYYALDERGYNFADLPRVPREYLPKGVAPKETTLTPEQVADLKSRLRAKGLTTQPAVLRALQEALGPDTDMSFWDSPITNTQANRLIDHLGA